MSSVAVEKLATDASFLLRLYQKYDDSCEVFRHMISASLLDLEAYVSVHVPHVVLICSLFFYDIIFRSKP